MLASGAVEVCRVVIADDQPLFAEGLARIIDATSDLRVVAVADSLRALHDMPDETAPDVLLLDYRLSDGQGIEAVPELRRRWPDVAVILLTGYVSQFTQRRAQQAGCVAFLSKDELPSAVVLTIRDARLGRSPGVSAEAAGDRGGLTPRELEVLALLAEGLGPADIAQRLFIGVNTARNHVQRILGKLGVSSQLEAVVKAIREGLVPRP